MTIGDFSRATGLSAKTLRYYHQEGLLAPAQVGAQNGYRLYTAEQLGPARVIKHLRALDMPLDDIRTVLAAPSVPRRNALVAEHLARMEARLEETRAAVASLRALLAPTPAAVPVEHRSVPATPVAAVRETIAHAALGRWYRAAGRALDAVVASGAVRPVGHRGGVWATGLFLDGQGEAVLFVPVAADAPALPSTGRVRLELLSAVELVVAVHEGDDSTIGEVYAALGDHVARHELSVDGPLRETYLETAAEHGRTTTEIGWPIFRATR